jgi:hypothetical protein
MKHGIFAAAATAALVAITPRLFAADPAVLRFADLGGIENWRPADERSSDAILIEGRNDQWYRATFWAPCPEIHFTPTIGFVTDTLGNLDQFTSIIAEGRQCHFRTFERTSNPDETANGLETTPVR